MKIFFQQDKCISPLYSANSIRTWHVNYRHLVTTITRSDCIRTRVFGGISVSACCAPIGMALRVVKHTQWHVLNALFEYKTKQVGFLGTRRFPRWRRHVRLGRRGLVFVQEIHSLARAHCPLARSQSRAFVARETLSTVAEPGPEASLPPIERPKRGVLRPTGLAVIRQKLNKIPPVYDITWSFCKILTVISFINDKYKNFI